MLKLPAFRYFDDATVFQDDAEINRFYVIAGFPSIRRDKNGNPVFLLIKYAFSDQSREEDDGLPRGGGYLAFDAELSISDDRRQEIKRELQKWVNAEWEKMKDPSYRGGTHKIEMSATLPNSPVSNMWKSNSVGFTGRSAPAVHSSRVDGTIELPGHDDWTPPGANEPPPEVVFGEPQWKSGKVRLLAPQAEGLVSSRVAEQPAALVGDNVAAFSMDLSVDGATFMQRTLLEPDGSGGTDLSPLQVVYELVLVARLPPARALIKYDAMDVYRDIQELWHEKCTGCGDDFFTSESMMAQAMKAGLVTVKIDAGGTTDPEMLQLITEQALGTAREIVVDTFTEKIETPDGPPDSWAAADTGVPDEVSIVMAEEEVYRLKQRTEVSMTNFEQVIELAASTDYAIAPQGTLQPFFNDFSPEDMRRFVREIDLDDDFFKTLALSVRAYANWQEDHVAFVELEVFYGKGDRLKTNTFTFTPTNNEPQKWDPGLVDGNRQYTYRWRVAFEGREAGAWSATIPATTRDLNVSVRTPGKIKTEVVGAGLDYATVLNAVLVHLRYQDTARDVPLAGTSLLLTQDRRSGTWEHLIYAPWDKPIEYAVEYLLQDGSTVRTGWQKTQGPQSTLMVGPPQVDVLNINVIPAGIWTDVIQSVVDLAYADPGHDYNTDTSFQLKTPDELKRWAVLLRDPRVRKFKYKVLTTFKNGDSETSDWITKEGDQTIALDVEGPPRLRVTVMGRVIDYEDTPTVKVSLQHTDAGDLGHRTQSFTLTGPDDEHVWDIPISDRRRNKYSYRIEYFPKEIDPVQTEWITTTSDRIIPPRYDVPRVGARLVPSMVDFAETPVVEVELKYADPQRGVLETETLIFDEKKPQSWFISVEDGASRTYSVRYRYHLADGNVVEGELKRTESSALVIPRYRPAA